MHASFLNAIVKCSLIISAASFQLQYKIPKPLFSSVQLSHLPRHYSHLVVKQRFFPLLPGNPGPRYHKSAETACLPPLLLILLLQSCVAASPFFYMSEQLTDTPERSLASRALILLVATSLFFTPMLLPVPTIAVVGEVAVRIAAVAGTNVGKDVVVVKISKLDCVVVHLVSVETAATRAIL